MIDPAILRPGRLDVKIKIERPDAESARDIFSKYLTAEPAAARRRPRPSSAATATRRVAAMIQATVERMYTETEENRFLEVTYANGDKEVLYFKDFNSGAMIQNIVDRAKKMAIKDFLDLDQRGSAGPAPAPGLRRRVQGERGPAQHHQPRRLGADLRQEGRADRLHPHAHHRQAGHRARPLDRHRRQHRPVPVAGRRELPDALGPSSGTLVGRAGGTPWVLDRRRRRRRSSSAALAARQLARRRGNRATWQPSRSRRRRAGGAQRDRLDRDRQHPERPTARGSDVSTSVVVLLVVVAACGRCSPSPGGPAAARGGWVDAHGDGDAGQDTRRPGPTPQTTCPASTPAAPVGGPC